MNADEVVNAFRRVWRRARGIATTITERLTDRERMIAGDIMRSAQQFATELLSKEHTPTKLADLDRTARHLDGMLDRIDAAAKERTA